MDIDIHVYTLRGCGDCLKAIKALENKGYKQNEDFAIHDAQHHLDNYLPDAKDIMAQMAYVEGDNPLPAISFKGKWCNLEGLKEILNA